MHVSCRGHSVRVIDPKRVLECATDSESSTPVQVHSIDLSSNALMELSGLISFTALSVLDVSRNKLTSLKGLPMTITRLRATYNQLTHITGVEALPNLIELNLSHNRIVDMTGLARCEKLKILKLGFNKIKLVECIEHIRPLEVLDLEENLVGEVSDIRSISLLVNLKAVNLSGNPVTKLPSYAISCRNLLPRIQFLDGKPRKGFLRSSKELDRGKQGSSELSKSTTVTAPTSSYHSSVDEISVRSMWDSVPVDRGGKKRGMLSQSMISSSSSSLLASSFGMGKMRMEDVDGERHYPRKRVQRSISASRVRKPRTSHDGGKSIEIDRSGNDDSIFGRDSLDSMFQRIPSSPRKATEMSASSSSSSYASYSPKMHVATSSKDVEDGPIGLRQEKMSHTDLEDEAMALKKKLSDLRKAQKAMERSKSELEREVFEIRQTSDDAKDAMHALQEENERLQFVVQSTKRKAKEEIDSLRSKVKTELARRADAENRMESMALELEALQTHINSEITARKMAESEVQRLTLVVEEKHRRLEEVVFSSVERMASIDKSPLHAGGRIGKRIETSEQLSETEKEMALEVQETKEKQDADEERKMHDEVDANDDADGDVDDDKNLGQYEEHVEEKIIRGPQESTMESATKEEEMHGNEEDERVLPSTSKVRTIDRAVGAGYIDEMSTSSIRGFGGSVSHGADESRYVPASGLMEWRKHLETSVMSPAIETVSRSHSKPSSGPSRIASLSKKVSQDHSGRGGGKSSSVSRSLFRRESGLEMEDPQSSSKEKTHVNFNELQHLAGPGKNGSQFMWESSLRQPTSSQMRRSTSTPSDLKKHHQYHEGSSSPERRAEAARRRVLESLQEENRALALRIQSLFENLDQLSMGSFAAVDRSGVSRSTKTHATSSSSSRTADLPQESLISPMQHRNLIDRIASEDATLLVSRSTEDTIAFATKLKRWLQLEMEKTKNILEMRRRRSGHDDDDDDDDRADENGGRETSQMKVKVGSIVDGECKPLVQEMVLAMKEGDREMLAQLLSKLPIEEAAKLLVEAQEVVHSATTGSTTL
eukprot:TRINITY_DN2642_c0_g2_i1.p1 TRINITY_DN2642_c0_g2~~TRINITY_DN2642_c0_g2_i1.p1  ORF type:complete len:1055 (-),score=312.29 TRINITY_DN2642_c0_g2_i1:139-3303(-)